MNRRNFMHHLAALVPAVALAHVPLGWLRAAATDYKPGSVVRTIENCMADLKRRGLDPRRVIIQPLEWEKEILVKSGPGHYLRQCFPDHDGTLRVWGITRAA